MGSEPAPVGGRPTTPMRIALTHNLQTTDSEDQAEFDRPETIAVLAAALRRLGHDVEPVEVSGPASRIVARLEALAPDLVFNTAEGHRGRCREAFYPALLEELGLPYTGSDPYVCTLTLDKQLTKRVVAAHGVRTPAWRFVERPEDVALDGLRLPVIVKPNYEGSSKGVTRESIVTRARDLEARTTKLLRRYPAGVLIEEFIEGRDATVPFLEAFRDSQGGLLPPAEYVFDDVAADEHFPIYDYRRKQHAPDAVRLRVPAALGDEARDQLLVLSELAVRALGLRDLGRLDYRVTPEGVAYFLEVNALPSLEPGASLYESAKTVGLTQPHEVLELVIASAMRRQGVVGRIRGRRKRSPLRVGVIFNLKRTLPTASGDDEEAEFDGASTIEAISTAIRSHGHEVVELEATPELPTLLPEAHIDLAFNVAEGMRGRSREAQVPALLELLGIPYTGSDPATLALALDKGLAKRVVAQAGVRTAPFLVMRSGRERIPAHLSFPVIVKPLAEGSSKGIWSVSVVETEQELRGVIPPLASRYGQPVLVETFLPGREFTVGLLGERRPKVLPPMEVVFTSDARFPIYTYEHKLEVSDAVRYDAPARVEAGLEAELKRVARQTFAALGCRDVARIDLRLDDGGRVCFVECNPLPGLTPEWSDLCLIASSAGMSYSGLIGEILTPALARLRDTRRGRSLQRAATG